jgi:putative endonuclease
MDFINSQHSGWQAEQKAKIYLLSRGLCLLEQNYRCFQGEIDLIMRDQEDIVFVEVKSRSRMDYGYPAETVNKSKQKKIIKTATHFLQKKGWLYTVNSRVDVIAMLLIDGEWQLDWIKNAFSVEY